MNYLHFIDLFGRTSDDPVLKEKLQAEGVTSIPPIPRDEDSVSVELDGCVLGFSDPHIPAW